MNLNFSIIIPVYNRPEEVRELLESLDVQKYEEAFEVVIVEDGSTESSEMVVREFEDLDISYFFKENSGPGDSRNYGMQRAKGTYFIIFDSDCIIPPNYLEEVSKNLHQNYVDFFGGPDAAHEDFSAVQKAINYAMTSLITTGGIRGKKESLSQFEPRSFNMGISREAFKASGGFATIHPGEDPDLSIRLWELGFKSCLISEAFVYHKRRISWSKFYTQVQKFGLVRPILTKWHPQTAKITFWFPSFFFLGILTSFILSLFQIFLPVLLLTTYLTLVLIESALRNKSLVIGGLSVYAVLVQFTGYGLAFLEATLKIRVLKKDARQSFPHLFFE